MAVVTRAAVAVVHRVDGCFVCGELRRTRAGGGPRVCQAGRDCSTMKKCNRSRRRREKSMEVTRGSRASHVRTAHAWRRIARFARAAAHTRVHTRSPRWSSSGRWQHTTTPSESCRVGRGGTRGACAHARREQAARSGVATHTPRECAWKQQHTLSEACATVLRCKIRSLLYTSA